MVLYSLALVASIWLQNGWENVFHCEWNEFGQKILKYYWPNAISYGDITKTDFTIHRGKIDIITGGFPCQPYSLAGKRKSKEDERHLWPEMLRAIREIQPGWVVGENVPGIINWPGGLVFHEVQIDLEAERYEVFPVVLPACSTNAPHLRDRVWFIAHSNGIRREEIQRKTNNAKECNIQNNKRSSVYMGSCFTIFDEKGEGLYESGICGTDDGIPKRMDRLTALGNAIVPTVDYQIFKAIEETNSKL